MAASGNRRKPTVDDLRTAFYRQASDRQWIREVSLDPLELIVSDDRDGTIMRVPVAVAASGEISFGKPARVRMEYVLAGANRLDTSRTVYATASESRAANGTHVYATISRGKEPAAMVQPQKSNHPGDQPRRPTEDPVSWALSTGRIGPEREEFWRRQVAASARVATEVLECLAPGCAVPLTAAGRPLTVAASVPARPAGVPAHWFDPNPLVSQMRQHNPGVYQDATSHGGPVPTLFGAGDLPVATSSGIDPRVLANQPWPVRHPLATARTSAEVEDIMAVVADMGQHFDGGEWMSHDGNKDYESRVTSWAMRGIDAAARHRVNVETADKLQLQQVAAASSPADLGDDEIYDRVYGDLDRASAERHLESLCAAASGQAVGAALSPREARTLIEAYAAGHTVAASVPGDRFRGRVPADMARKALDALNATTDVRWSR